MFPELTTQERQALYVIALLIAGGAVARHLAVREETDSWLAYSAEAADSIGAGDGSALLARVEAEVAKERIRSMPLGADEKINPNQASPEQLDRLPRVGPALAERIVAEREAGGPFQSLQDLSRVSGIGPAMLKQITPYLELPDLPQLPRSGPGMSSGISINLATAVELETLPGIGPAIAGRIVEYREKNGPFVSFSDLEKVSGIGPRLRERIEALARL
jgi:competence protein ComEA